MKLYVVILSTLVCAQNLFSQQVEPEVFTLDNGMKFILLPRTAEPNNVAVGWLAKVGSVNERPGITGLSHYFEHLMFKGTNTIGTSDVAADAEFTRNDSQKLRGAGNRKPDAHGTTVRILFDPAVVPDNSVDIGEVLLVTFTEDAARELGERTRRQLAALVAHADAGTWPGDDEEGIRVLLDRLGALAGGGQEALGPGVAPVAATLGARGGGLQRPGVEEPRQRPPQPQRP